MTGAVVVAALFRWLGFVAEALVVGSLVVGAVVIPRDTPEAGASRRRLARLGVAGLAVLIATSLAELVLRAQTMTGGALAAALPALPSVLARTHFGAVWTARLALLLVAWAVSVGRSGAARLIVLGLMLGVTLTTTLTGHAADRGDLTVSVAVDFMHLVSVSVWGGGVIALALASPWGRGMAASPLGVLLGRFSRLAGACLAAAVLTGGYRVWMEIPRPSALWSTAYGRALVVKLALVAAAVGCGALVRYAVLPRLGGDGTARTARLLRRARSIPESPTRATPPALTGRLGSYIAREALLMVLVLAATAVLVDSTPARHAGHARHLPLGAAGPFRVTMEDLHEGGGVPSGWTFTPPAGDAARGHRVFATLGCGACHRAGKDSRAPSGIGPDLDGVGRHHPSGYILESILNPNAVIVEGPGYTGPDGKSIMPDFRDQLSVPDLIDLVAYLETL